MPPGPAFGWLCILHSVSDIVVGAAQIRSSQVLPARHVVSLEFHLHKSSAEEGSLKTQFAGDAQSMHDPQKSPTNDTFSTDPPVSISLSYLDEPQVTPMLLHSRSIEQVPSEQSSMVALFSISTGHVLDPPLPDDPKLPVTHAALLLESSFENVSSLELSLDSAPIPSVTKALGHKIDNSVPVYYEWYF
ncbi:hypothetical protein AZE42_12464 [Rhizopogon vesiculosus]|uniref:Uncharacterized protein n=1 Tax=Rhizopogon vesiculosus TaxID=180088 RepID=A0A1J8QHD3_9AGAM|nr:hypothetical protein AZE42_12464 [Rhizopogon vesiculosus]